MLPKYVCNNFPINKLLADYPMVTIRLSRVKLGVVTFLSIKNVGATINVCAEKVKIQMNVAENFFSCFSLSINTTLKYCHNTLLNKIQLKQCFPKG